MAHHDMKTVGGKKYGLIISKNRAPKLNRPSAFDDSDDEEKKKKKLSSLPLTKQEVKLKKQTQMEIAKAMAVDPTVYEYDKVYDDMKQKENPKDPKILEKNKEKKPKYIAQLLKSAEERKKENERRDHKKAQKERELEGDEFADKEAFVTSAYKKKLEEQKAEEEREKRQSELEAKQDVTKQDDLTNFYRHILDQSSGNSKPDIQVKPEPTEDLKSTTSTDKEKLKRDRVAGDGDSTRNLSASRNPRSSQRSPSPKLAPLEAKSKRRSESRDESKTEENKSKGDDLSYRSSSRRRKDRDFSPSPERHSSSKHYQRKSSRDRRESPVSDRKHKSASKDRKKDKVSPNRPEEETRSPRDSSRNSRRSSSLHRSEVMSPSDEKRGRQTTPDTSPASGRRSQKEHRLTDSQSDLRDKSFSGSNDETDSYRREKSTKDQISVAPPQPEDFNDVINTRSEAIPKQPSLSEILLPPPPLLPYKLVDDFGSVQPPGQLTHKSSDHVSPRSNDDLKPSQSPILAAVPEPAPTSLALDTRTASQRPRRRFTTPPPELVPPPPISLPIVPLVGAMPPSVISAAFPTLAVQPSGGDGDDMSLSDDDDNSSPPVIPAESGLHGTGVVYPQATPLPLAPLVQPDLPTALSFTPTPTLSFSPPPLPMALPVTGYPPLPPVPFMPHAPHVMPPLPTAPMPTLPPIPSSTKVLVPVPFDLSSIKLPEGKPPSRTPSGRESKRSKWDQRQTDDAKALKPPVPSAAPPLPPSAPVQPATPCPPPPPKETVEPSAPYDPMDAGSLYDPLEPSSDEPMPGETHRVSFKFKVLGKDRSLKSVDGETPSEDPTVEDPVAQVSKSANFPPLPPPHNDEEKPIAESESKNMPDTFALVPPITEQKVTHHNHSEKTQKFDRKSIHGKRNIVQPAQVLTSEEEDDHRPNIKPNVQTSDSLKIRPKSPPNKARDKLSRSKSPKSSRSRDKSQMGSRGRSPKISRERTPKKVRSPKGSRYKSRSPSISNERSKKSSRRSRSRSASLPKVRSSRKSSRKSRSQSPSFSTSRTSTKLKKSSSRSPSFSKSRTSVKSKRSRSRSRSMSKDKSCKKSSRKSRSPSPSLSKSRSSKKLSRKSRSRSKSISNSRVSKKLSRKSASRSPSFSKVRSSKKSSRKSYSRSPSLSNEKSSKRYSKNLSRSPRKSPICSSRVSRSPTPNRSRSRSQKLSSDRSSRKPAKRTKSPSSNSSANPSPVQLKSNSLEVSDKFMKSATETFPREPRDRSPKPVKAITKRHDVLGRCDSYFGDDVLERSDSNFGGLSSDSMKPSRRFERRSSDDVKDQSSRKVVGSEYDDSDSEGLLTFKNVKSKKSHAPSPIRKSSTGLADNREFNSVKTRKISPKRKFSEENVKTGIGRDSDACGSQSPKPRRQFAGQSSSTIDEDFHSQSSKNAPLYAVRKDTVTERDSSGSDDNDLRLVDMPMGKMRKVDTEVTRASPRPRDIEPSKSRVRSSRSRDPVSQVTNSMKKTRELLPQKKSNLAIGLVSNYSSTDNSDSEKEIRVVKKSCEKPTEEQRTRRKDNTSKSPSPKRLAKDLRGSDRGPMAKQNVRRGRSSSWSSAGEDISEIKTIKISKRTNSRDDVLHSPTKPNSSKTTILNNESKTFQSTSKRRSFSGDESDSEKQRISSYSQSKKYRTKLVDKKRRKRSVSPCEDESRDDFTPTKDNTNLDRKLQPLSDDENRESDDLDTKNERTPRDIREEKKFVKSKVVSTNDYPSSDLGQQMSSPPDKLRKRHHSPDKTSSSGKIRKFDDSFSDKDHELPQTKRKHDVAKEQKISYSQNEGAIVKVQFTRRNTDASINAARARYLARKRAREGDSS